MKLTSTTALALALALGVAGVSGVATAAKKTEEAKQPDYKLTPALRTAISAAQKAMTANDNATTAAKLAEAKALIKTDDDRYIYSSVLFDLSRRTNDKAQQNEALEGLLGSPRLPADQRGKILLATGQDAYTAGNYPLADQRLSEALKLNPDDTNTYALLAETRFKAGRPAEAVAMFQQAMDRAKAKGTKLPAEWYGRAVAISYNAKLAQQSEALTTEWVSTYPTKDNWRDTLQIWRDLHKPDAETELDLMRLTRSVGALKGAADYMDYVNVVYVKNPGEAKAVLDEGVKAGFVNLASNKNASEINALSVTKIPGDKASLPKSATDAKGPKGTAKLALNVADGYLGYEMWPQAVDMYKLALSKGADANLVNTRIGMALARSGDKEGAKAAFAQVTGPRAALAKYWLIYLDQGAAVAA